MDGPTVLLSDPEPLFRLGMRMACEAGGVHVVSEVDAPSALWPCVGALTKPVVIVTHAHILEPDREETVRALAATPRILVLDGADLDKPRLLRAGASGFIGRGVEPTELRRAVAAAERGELVLETDVHTTAPQTTPLVPIVHLTPREIDVLRLIAAGHSTDRAAERLNLSPTTLKTHLRNVSEKLGTTGRAATAVHASALGLLE